MCLWPDGIMFSLSGGLQTSLALCMQANQYLHAGLGNLNICSNELLPSQCSHIFPSLCKRDTHYPLTSLFYQNKRFETPFQLIIHYVWIMSWITA